MNIEIKPEDMLLSRAWLIKHGWEPCKDFPLFKYDPDCLDADLCVILTRKMYMVAYFHNMGDYATNPEVTPSCIEVRGLNNNIEMLDISHSFLVVAVSICGIGGCDRIEKAIGGKYDIIITKKEDEE